MFPAISYRYHDCTPGRIFSILFRKTHEISSRCSSMFPLRNSYSRVSQRGARKYDLLPFEGAVPRAHIYVHRENAVDSSFAMHNHLSRTRTAILSRFSSARSHSREYIFARVSARFGFHSDSFTTASPDASNIS